MESEWQRAVNDLASTDAHTEKAALSTSYNVSDRLSHQVIQKSVRAYSSFMKRMPIELIDETIEPEEFEKLVKTSVKRGIKRKAQELAHDDEGGCMHGSSAQDERQREQN